MNSTTTQYINTAISPNQASALRVLLYYDIFNYPLTAHEIFSYAAHKQFTDTQLALDQLVNARVLETADCKYFLAGRAQTVANRQQLNERAAAFTGKVNNYTKLIAGFPFVKGVLVTGSLSKGCMEPDGDIDYLIITTPGRLWLCRTLLTAYKKTVLFNSRKYFCVNYYVDELNLQIPDHNIFTATEISSAQPAYNAAACNSFFAANSWTAGYFPNFKHTTTFTVHEDAGNPRKALYEKLLGGKLGNWLDELTMRLFVWRWRSKFKGTDKADFEVNFRSRKNVSKHHPNGFQFKVLNAYQKNIQSLEERFNFKLQ